jgi:phage protein D
METVRKNTAEIIIAGKNVTGDVSRYLSKITYNDKLEYESDDMSLVFEDTSGKWQSTWYPQQGDSLQVKLGDTNGILDCGLFEIDEIELEFPPDALTVKAIAASIKKSLRTKNSKAFEQQTLRDIAVYFTSKHGLGITGNLSNLQKIEIDRKTQDRETDLSFLAKLAKEYGIIFSMRGNNLVFIDAEDLEKQPPVLTIHRSVMSMARFRDKTSEVYIGVIIGKRNAQKNENTQYHIVTGKLGEGDFLIIEEDDDIENVAQAEARGMAALNKKKKEKYSGSFTTPGNIKLVSGININLTGIGRFSGKWLIISSSHSIEPSGGYTTSVEVQKIES